MKEEKWSKIECPRYVINAKGVPIEDVEEFLNAFMENTTKDLVERLTAAGVNSPCPLLEVDPYITIQLEYHYPEEE